MKTCEFCGKELAENNGRGRPNRFCSVSCSTKYHNELKRAERQKPLLEAEILRQRDNLFRGGQLQIEALGILVKVLSLSHHQVNISCKKCGQKRYELPLKMETCSFCGGNEWNFAPKFSVGTEKS